MKRWATGVGVAACIAMMVAGCGTDSPAPTSSAGAPTSDSARVEPVGTTSSTPTVASRGTPVTAGHGKCLDVTSPVVTEAVGRIDSYYGRIFVPYRATDSPLGSCPDLMWVEAHIRGATGSSPRRVLLFDADGFIRTDTDQNTAFTQVTGSTGDSVEVTYRWLDDGDATAHPTGGPVVVTFTRAGGRVTADRAVPPQAYGDRLAPTSTAATTTTITPPASHCGTATPATLHDAADMQYGTRLTQPFTLVDIICDGQWAIARTQSAAPQPVRVLFRYTGGGWSALDMGSGFVCTDKGVPAETATKLECG